MKQKTTWLLFWCAVSASTMAQSYPSVDSLNSYIISTIKDKRPAKVTVDEMRNAFLGISGFLSNTPIRKLGNGLTLQGDSLFLGGKYSSLALYNDQGGFTATIASNPGDVQLYTGSPDGTGGSYILNSEGTHVWNSYHTSNFQMALSNDSLALQDNLSLFRPFVIYRNGSMRLSNFKNTSVGINYLSTDASGFVKLTPLKLGSGLKYQQNTLDIASNNQLQVLQYASATTWDISNGVNAQLLLAGNTTLTITNAAAVQQGVLIATTSVAGSTITFPANSYQLKSDGYDSGNLNPFSDNTKVGKNADGSNATGTWLCSFLYDGTNYYWTIKRAS